MAPFLIIVTNEKVTVNKVNLVGCINKERVGLIQQQVAQTQKHETVNGQKTNQTEGRGHQQ